MISARYSGRRCFGACGQGFALRLFALLVSLVFGAVPSSASERGPAGIRTPGEVRTEWGFDASASAGLFIGIRHFKDENFEVVPYAVDDAVDLAHLFSVELGLIDPTRVVLCLSGEPQKAESSESPKCSPSRTESGDQLTLTLLTRRRERASPLTSRVFPIGSSCPDTAPVTSSWRSSSF